MSNPLSKEAESKVLSAIQHINHEFVHGPMTAEALHASAVKTARDNGFGPDMIRLMCAGYNTGATLAQREGSDSILEKHASFPLAEADQIIQAVFPTVTVEKLAAAREATLVSDEYSRPPRNPQLQHAAWLDKQADRTLVPLTPPPPPPVQDFHKKYGEAQRLQRAIQTARYASMEAEEGLIEAVGELGQYFKQASHNRQWTFGEVKFAAVRRHQKVGELVMKCVQEVNGYTVDTERRPDRPIDWQAAPFTLLDRCVKQAHLVNARRGEHVKVAVANRKKIAELVGDYRPSEKPAEPPAPTSVLRDKQAVGPTSGAINFAVVSGALKNLLGDHIKPQSTNSLVQGKLHDLSNPDHEEALRRIRAQAMLQGFLTDDPILSGHNPDEVMRTFNELNQMSPRAAQQPAIARSVLRRWMTQGSIEPFEAKEITDLEKNLNVTQGRVPQPAGTEDKVANVLRRRRSVVA